METKHGWNKKLDADLKTLTGKGASAGKQSTSLMHAHHAQHDKLYAKGRKMLNEVK